MNNDCKINNIIVTDAVKACLRNESWCRTSIIEKSVLIIIVPHGFVQVQAR